jgi:16S rRNA (cytidine1402-2'-O)-methyltransferase
MGKLFVVPTPIGNLQDMTYRAIDVLKSVDLILAEDTRQTAKLLKHFEIDTSARSYHLHNEHRATEAIVDQLKSGSTYALVSDAGTPAISDPGYLLSRACVQAGIEVECLPGATAFVPALVQSGIPCDQFQYLGFIPHKKGRQTLFQSLAQEERTTVCYESPHRIVKTLNQLVEFCGADRVLSISREISKLHAESLTNTAENVLKHFENNPPKGEFVLVIAGYKTVLDINELPAT